jgi:hypothetical protein
MGNRESELIEMVSGCMDVCKVVLERLERLEASLHMTHDDQHREEDEQDPDEIWV